MALSKKDRDVFVFHQRRPAGIKARAWDGWRVRYRGEILSTHHSQAAAHAAGKADARMHKVELLVTGKKTGKIVDKMSFGKDPRGRG